MTEELYETLALAARYLFSVLGVLIVIRSWLWLLSDHRARKASGRLPDSGCIGELVVMSGGPGLREGLSVPVPWEGVLGSVRSCDIWLPAAGVARKHLAFIYEPDQGLVFHPFRGCQAWIDNIPVADRSAPEHSMVHGSFLQVGDALLRLRVFAGLDPRAGFDQAVPEDQMPPQPSPQPAFMPVPPLPVLPAERAQAVSVPAVPLGMVPAPIPVQPVNPVDETGTESVDDRESDSSESGQTDKSRRRRGARWEADWSE